MKTCAKCKSEKEITAFSEFFRRDRNKLRISSYCKDCCNKANKQRFQDNPEKKLLQNKEWRDNNLEHSREWQREKEQTDVQYKLRRRLRGRLRDAVRNIQKAGSAVKDLGCSIQELKEHLEKQFQPGMAWDNWTTDGWHIDHKKALANFDLTDRQQFLEANHYTNLQPLWAKENLSKAAKIIK